MPEHPDPGSTAALALIEQGAGEAVVFVHGVGGCKENWLPQISALCSEYRCIAVDLPGYGASPDPEGPLTMAAFGRAILRVLDQRRIDRAHLVGLSMGGFIVQQLLRSDPQRLLSVTIADSGISLRAAAGNENAEAFVNSRQDMIRSGIAMAEIADRFTAALVHGGKSGPSYDAAFASMAQLRPDCYARALQAILDFENPGPGLVSAVPALILVGEHDQVLPVAASRQLAAFLGHPPLAVIPEAGHLANLDNPALFNHHLARHLRAAAPGHRSH